MYNGTLSNTMTSCTNCIDDTIDICCHNLQITCQLPVYVSVWYFLFQVDLTIRSTFGGVKVSHITVIVCVGWATQSKDCIDNNIDICYCNFDIHVYLWYSHINYQSMYWISLEIILTYQLSIHLLVFDTINLNINLSIQILLHCVLSEYQCLLKRLSE